MHLLVEAYEVRDAFAAEDCVLRQALLMPYLLKTRSGGSLGSNVFLSLQVTQ